MALNAYLTLAGETQGDIDGSVTEAGRENMILVIGFEHEIVSPRDAASGLPTGKRRHHPFVLTKEVDAATPLLYAALVNNENLVTWRLECYRPARTGRETHFYTVELENATIAGIRSEMLNNRYPENMRHPEREHVEFAYQKIIWTWEDGGITAEDDWETPTA